MPSRVRLDTRPKRRTKDLPQWLKDFYQSNLSGASSLRDSLTGSVNPLYGASDDELAKTVSGAYLSPDSNPYLSKTADIISGKIGRAVDSRFESTGRYGSGAHQDVLGTDIGNALTQLYGTNYASERGRQLSTAAGMPAYLSGETTAKFSPFTNFGRLIPNLKNSATTEPYFRNKGAGILGGALAGSQLGGMFGKMFGGGGGSMAEDGSMLDSGAYYGDSAGLDALIGGFGGGEAAGAAGMEEMLPMLLAA
jgi:hypothetical protein